MQSASPGPIVVQAPVPSKEPRDAFDWILLALGGIGTALFGGNVFANFRGKLGDGKIDDSTRIALLRAAQRGLPIADQFLNFPGEDIVEAIVKRTLDARLKSLGATSEPPRNEQLDELTSLLRNFLSDRAKPTGSGFTLPQKGGSQ